MQNGTLGDLYTTVEGLFSAIHKNLKQAAEYVMNGDSTTEAQKEAWTNLLNKLRFASTSDEEFTLILEDPLSNSWIYSPYSPEVDPRLVTVEYERTDEENEEMGLNDIKVDDYDETAEDILAE